MATAVRRRYVLRSVAGSLALPAVTSLSPAAVGDDAAVLMTTGAGVGARRFVAVGNLLGFQLKQFFPETAGRDFEATTLLQPLAENRHNINVYRGLDHGLRGGHFAVHTFLSGVLHHEAKHRRDGNVTVDQFIADEVGRQTRFASLTIGSEGGIHGGCQLSWTRSGIRIPPITGPAALFDRLFVSDPQHVQAGKVKANRLQASILDSVMDEAKGLSSRVNSEDRAKLDEYFTSIRDVEKRLAARQQWAGSPKPDAPFEKPADRNTVHDLPLLYELMALALQTDSTRVATMFIAGLGQVFTLDGVTMRAGYHALSHHGNDPDLIRDLVRVEPEHMTCLSRFLDQLKEKTDAQGRPVLDSTIVMFGTGMGDASRHSNRDLPTLVAGGGFDHGQHISSDPGSDDSRLLGDVFLTILRQLGVESSRFSDATRGIAELNGVG